MPTYDYGCAECGHRFEEFQKITDAALVTCPACGKDRLERLITSANFVLKGGGWYKDGYGASKSGRTEKQVTDRLQKAIDDDKKKSAASSDSSSSSSSGSSGSSGASGGSGSASS